MPFVEFDRGLLGLGYFTSFEILVCKPYFSIFTCLSLNLSSFSSLPPSGLTLHCLGLFYVAFTCVLRFAFQNHATSYPSIQGHPP